MQKIGVIFERILHYLGIGDFLKFSYRHGFSAFRQSTAKISDESIPVPPPYLVYLVIGQPNQELFLTSGKSQVYELMLPMLSKVGLSFKEVGPVLDFGCGCGRLSRHLIKEGAEVWGCDINRKLIRWCRRHLHQKQFFRNDLSPPLQLATESFSLILARSVFTHLPVDLQKAWLEEYRRVLKPGGYLWITLSGDHFKQYLTETELANYNEGTVVVRKKTLSGSNDCAVFHPPTFAKKFLQDQGFIICQMVPGSAVKDALQDSYLCQKSDTV